MSEFVETNYEAAGEAAALSGSMDQPTTMSQGTFFLEIVKFVYKSGS